MSEEQSEGRNLHQAEGSMPAQPEIERDPVTAEKVEEKQESETLSNPVNEDETTEVPKDKVVESENAGEDAESPEGDSDDGDQVAQDEDGENIEDRDQHGQNDEALDPDPVDPNSNNELEGEKEDE